MGRIPCCEEENVKRGQWTPEEDKQLSSYIAQHGTRNWRLIPKNAGLQFGPASFGNEGDDVSPFSQSVYTGSTCTTMDQQCQLQGKLEEENGHDHFETSEGIGSGSNISNSSDSVLWDLPPDDLVNALV